MPDRWFDGAYYKREITINYMDCNTEKQVFLHYILGIFSEIAGDESQAKGRSHEFYVNRGRLFLITRMSIRFHRIPKCNETLTFTTWFRNTQGKFYLRDCDVSSPDGELIASASGTWALIDPVEHRVLDINEQSDGGLERLPRISDSPECKKIVPEVPLTVIGYRPVYYTDLDCNYHINNSAYSRIATDFLPPEYRSREVRDFVINFNKETRLEETIQLRGGAVENGYIIQGFCDDVLHFACEFIFREQ